MLIPFGVLSAAGAAVGDVDAYELIQTFTVGTATSEISFTSLATYASDYKHLQLRLTVRSTRDGAFADLLALRLNTDTGANYAWHGLRGSGLTVSSTGATSTSSPQLGEVPATAATANVFNSAVVDLLDPYSTTKNTTVRSLNGFQRGNSFIGLHSILHMSTSAISSIQIFNSFGNIVAGSRLSLYGIR
jgi:hypothetical protein